MTKQSFKRQEPRLDHGPKPAASEVRRKRPGASRTALATPATRARATADGAGRRSRKAREVERIREDILSAAARAFARRGYHATTMEQVAREAGYAVGSLYTYFPGKRELFQALLETIADQLKAVAERPLPSSLTFRQRFETLIVQQLELIEKNRGFVVSFFAQAPGIEADRGSDATPVFRDLYQRNIDRVSGLAAVAMDAGELRRSDPRDVGYFVVDVVYGAVVRWATGDLAGSLAAHAPTLTRLIFGGIGAAAERAS